MAAVAATAIAGRDIDLKLRIWTGAGNASGPSSL
jgi:hypothetical protein